MTRTEELVRSTAHAIAGTVTQVGPLRLPDGVVEFAAGARGGSPAGGSRPVHRPLVRLDGGVRRPQARRWLSWGAPAAAAATVIALAVSLAIVKAAPNGSEAPPAGQARVLSSVPRYFVAVTASNRSNVANRLLVGDTLTGKTLASVASPSGTPFWDVWAAADDRTFAIFTQRTGGPSPSGDWYLLRLKPGGSPLATLSHLPIKPLSGVVAAGLSGSGKELAVARTAGRKGLPWLGIYSVATGRLLRSWSVRGTPAFQVDWYGNRSLIWTNSDSAIAFLTTPLGSVAKQTMWRLNVASTGGDLVKDSQVIWSSSRESCGSLKNPLASADGKTVSCGEVLVAWKYTGPLPWTMRWLAYPAAGSTAPRVLYQASVTTRMSMSVDTVWVNATGSTLLVYWTLWGGKRGQPSVHFGIVSHGTFTPLTAPVVSGEPLIIPPGIAW
jgi:hypothetical protein